MTDHSKGLGRQLLVMVAVLLGAILLLTGLLPAQVAKGKEQQQQQIPTPPQVAQDEEQQQQQQVLGKDPQVNEYVAGESFSIFVHLVARLIFP